MNKIIYICFVGMIVLSAVANAESKLTTTHKESITYQYRKTVEKIVRATMAQNDAYNKLEHLCLHIGHRLSGSRSLEKAIDWAVNAMKKDGQENVHREMVMVPHWVRGYEAASMIEPRIEPFFILGLGGSVGTGPEGITAEVVVAEDEDALNALGDKARGKIVLFNKVMPPYDSEEGAHYGATVKYRLVGSLREQTIVICSTMFIMLKVRFVEKP